jgi:hypothetical protein
MAGAMVGVAGIIGGGITGGAIITRIDVAGTSTHRVGNGKAVAHTVKSGRSVSRGPDNNDSGYEKNHADRRVDRWAVNVDEFRH